MVENSKNTFKCITLLALVLALKHAAIYTCLCNIADFGDRIDGVMVFVCQREALFPSAEV